MDVLLGMVSKRLCQPGWLTGSVRTLPADAPLTRLPGGAWIPAMKAWICAGLIILGECLALGTLRWVGLPPEPPWLAWHELKHAQWENRKAMEEGEWERGELRVERHGEGMKLAALDIAESFDPGSTRGLRGRVHPLVLRAKEITWENQKQLMDAQIRWADFSDRRSLLENHRLGGALLVVADWIRKGVYLERWLALSALLVITGALGLVVPAHRWRALWSLVRRAAGAWAGPAPARPAAGSASAITN